MFNQMKLGTTFVVLAAMFTQGLAQVKMEWEATGAALIAKSTAALIEYSAKGPNPTAVHKYKLFDVAFGKVLMETNGRNFYTHDSRFLILDDKYVTTYELQAEKVVTTGKFDLSSISKTGYNDIKVVGFSKKHFPIFKLVGSAESTYYIYNLTTKTTVKLAPPTDFYKGTFMPQSGTFVYMVQAGGKHVCYSYNPENNEVSVTGTINSVPDEKFYRVQISPNGKHAIYGSRYVYDLANNKMLYQLPVSNQDINWTGDNMAYSGQQVSATFSLKGDSIIIVKRMKENMQSTEKVQIEIFDTTSDKSVKSFFFNYKGDVMTDSDVPSGWAAFLRDGKVKIVHLTTKKVVREFSFDEDRTIVGAATNASASPAKN